MCGEIAQKNTYRRRIKSIPRSAEKQKWRARVDRSEILLYTVGMQKKFEEMSIKEYNTLLGSNEPTPGGGSALCQVGALACSLTEMAINVTVDGRSCDEKTRTYLAERRKEILQAKETLLRLSNEDALAFGRITNGFRLPKNTPNEAETRAAELQEAYRQAALVPLEVMEVCRTLAIANAEILPLLGKYVASDCVIANDLLRTVAKNSMLNVRANVSLLRDGATASSLEKKGENILRELSAI